MVYRAAAAREQDPSGATARTAAFLVALIGLWHVVGLVTAVLSLSGDTSAREMIVGIGLNALVAVLSLSGAVALFVREPVGRMLAVLGGSLAIAVYLFHSLAAAPDGLRTGVGVAALAIAGVPALVALIFALLPSTGRWLNRDADGVTAPSSPWARGGGNGATS